MEAKHTPGPWKLNTDGDTGMNDSGCILDSIGHVIVTDIYGTFKNGRTTGEAEANARLIAAAPEMLEALYQALARLEAAGLEDTTTDIIKTAIAKATGEK